MAVAGGARVCETLGCENDARLQCPTCIKLGIQGSYFCSQVQNLVKITLTFSLFSMQACCGCNGYQSTRHTVMSAHGHVVTRSTRHRSSRHRHISSHSQLVTSEHITKPPVSVVIIYTPSASGDGKGYFADCGMRKVVNG